MSFMKLTKKHNKVDKNFKNNLLSTKKFANILVCCLKLSKKKLSEIKIISALELETFCHSH